MTQPNSASSDTAIVKGPGGELVVPVERTDGMRRGVVSLPHGWGMTAAASGSEVAAGQPGVNVNQLNDGTALDPLSGTAVLQRHPGAHRTCRLIALCAPRVRDSFCAPRVRASGQLPDHRH